MQTQNTQDLQSVLALRAQKYLKENDQLLKKHKLIVQLVVSFTRRTKTPLLSKIALWIVSKQGGQIDIQFGIKRKG